MSTGIPYVDEVCNAVIGCTKCSPACDNCWAVGVIDRLEKCGMLKYAKLTWTTDPVYYWRYEWTGNVKVDFDAFKKCRGKKLKSFLLSSLGDWLHESLSVATIQFLLEVMGQTPQHRFYTLTKRPERWKELGPIPPNVWLGASVWDQASYDEAGSIEDKMRFTDRHWLSLEPLLGPIRLKRRSNENWIVVGAESGKNRRPCKIEWIDSIVRQCKEYKIPCFVKQLDIDGKCSADPLDWPMGLQIQEIPQ